MLFKITKANPIKDSEKHRLVLVANERFATITVDTLEGFDFKAGLTFKLGAANATTNTKCSKAVEIPDTNLEEDGDKFYTIIKSEGIQLVDAE